MYIVYAKSNETIHFEEEKKTNAKSAKKKKAEEFPFLKNNTIT